MGKRFIDLVYELAPNYTVTMEVMYITTRIQPVDTKKPGLRKVAVFRLTDLPEGVDMDEFCRQKLEELVEAIEK